MCETFLSLVLFQFIALQDKQIEWQEKILKMPYKESNSVLSKYPFSFKYSDKHSDNFLHTWHKESKTEKIDTDRQKLINIWLDQETGLKLTFEAIRFSDYPAIEWILYF